MKLCRTEYIFYFTFIQHFEYFFAALHLQQLSFSCENMAVHQIHLRCKQIPFSFHFCHACNRLAILVVSNNEELI